MLWNAAILSAIIYIVTYRKTPNIWVDRKGLIISFTYQHRQNTKSIFTEISICILFLCSYHFYLNFLVAMNQNIMMSTDFSMCLITEIYIGDVLSEMSVLLAHNPNCIWFYMTLHDFTFNYMIFFILLHLI